MFQITRTYLWWWCSRWWCTHWRWYRQLKYQQGSLCLWHMQVQ